MLCDQSLFVYVDSLVIVLPTYGVYLAAVHLQITKQIQAVNEVYKLHNLPEFYKVWSLSSIPKSSQYIAKFKQ